MFKVVWDKENNGVRLTMSSAGEALNIAPRPVFHEELDLFGLDKMGWKYIRSKAPLLWACERRYFYKGVCVMELRGGNLFDDPTVNITPEGKNLSLEPINLSTLAEINEDSMFILEHEAINFISDTYRRYKSLAAASKKNPNEVDFVQLANLTTQKTKEEHVVIKESCDSFDIMPLTEAERQGKVPILTTKIDKYIVSFSGGKDSQVVLDLVSRVIPAEDFLVIYSDTGYELPTSLELYEDVKKRYNNIYPELQFYTTKNHQEVLKYWDELDSPSRPHRWCCAVMKTAPLYRFLKELNGTGKQPSIMAFEGVRAEESERRSQYDKIGKGVKHNNVINVRPIFEWSVTEVWLYLLNYKLPLNEAYRKGLSRVGCVICPLSSELGDCLDYKFFRATAQPFVDKLKEKAINAGIKNVDEYLKERKWKVRAGGDRYDSSSKIEILSVSPDFKAKITNAKENIFEWIKVLGQTKIEKLDSKISIDVKYQHQIYRIWLTYIDNDAYSFTIEVSNVANDPLFIGHLKRVLQKVTYCVHCEVCEVECPTGALSVVPKVHVDDKKCVKCHKCLDFIDNGCEVANSIKQTAGLVRTTSSSSKRSAISKYNTFGMREEWVNTFLGLGNSFFESEDHGIAKKQLPIFLNWIRDAELLAIGTKQLSELGHILSQHVSSNRSGAWEILWTNLCENSDLCAWYISHVDFSRIYSREELDGALALEFPQYTATIRENAMKAFQNMLKESILGHEIPIGILSKEKNKVSYQRGAYNQLSLAGVAYSLYRYAEKVGRKSLTISELYNENQTEGVYRQFGIDRNSLEKKLRSLHEEGNQVLKVELMMGLDNITLREDLTSLDILKMLL